MTDESVPTPVTIRRFSDAELETLRMHLMRMGLIAIGQVRFAIKALVDNDPALAKQVIADDDELDDLEVKIDDEAISYISLRGPVAGDLRLLIVGMKASHDLERVGDEATSIAKRVIRLSSEPPLKPYIDLPRMAVIAEQMLQEALDCFHSGDTAKAIAVCKRDNEVDQLNKQLYRELAGFMVENPANISRALELMFISKSIERIADHATNIAEEMIFLAHGKDVRHRPELK
jgi:phosphate transport system protein